MRQRHSHENPSNIAKINEEIKKETIEGNYNGRKTFKSFQLGPVKMCKT